MIQDLDDLPEGLRNFAADFLTSIRELANEGLRANRPEEVAMVIRDITNDAQRLEQKWNEYFLTQPTED